MTNTRAPLPPGKAPTPAQILTEHLAELEKDSRVFIAVFPEEGQSQ